ncbi:ankyrin [Pholiota conissans]|uniref:Ankyrin n=1 Tax=Pholiota conissans TaxID=109636 RepID=A0A9P6D323_9AGAR|nr:ankyrin [Pholiota conissans]
MSNPQPSASFRSAAAYMSSSAPADVPTVRKLELYGLFKYITSSKEPSTPRPSIFDMTGRAKWDAWAMAFKVYGENGEAAVEERYLSVAREYGWTESTPVQTTTEESVSVNDDSVWDSDDSSATATSSRSREGTSGGLGVSVSSMAPPPEEHDNTMHGLVLANDVVGLTKLLENQSNTDVDAVDEFGYAPIHLACDRGNAEIVKILLQYGANRDVKDPDSLTPLELSHEAGHAEIEKLLLSS